MSDEAITVDRDATYWLEGNSVKMKLFYENRTRTIGVIDPIARAFMKFENMHGLHRETDSFSLPHSLLKWLESKGISGTKIVFEGIHYKALVKTWFEKGIFLYFKNRTEKKLYLKRSEFK